MGFPGQTPPRRQSPIKIGQLGLGHPELHRQVMGVAPHELIAEVMVLVASIHETLDIQADDPGQIQGPGIQMPVIRLVKPQPPQHLAFSESLDGDRPRRGR